MNLPTKVIVTGHHHHLICGSTQSVQGAIQLLHTYPCSCFKLETYASAATGHFAHGDGATGVCILNILYSFPLQEPPHLFLLPTPSHSPHGFFKSRKFQGIKRGWDFF